MFRDFIISMSILIRKIHCYSYAVYNRTGKYITAKLDLSKSQNLVFNLPMSIITKKIEPRGIEFMIHSQCKKNVDEYLRAATLTWEFAS